MIARNVCNFFIKQSSKRFSRNVKCGFDIPAEVYWVQVRKISLKVWKSKIVIIISLRILFLPKRFLWTPSSLTALPKVFGQKMVNCVAHGAKVMMRILIILNKTSK